MGLQRFPTKDEQKFWWWLASWVWGVVPPRYIDLPLFFPLNHPFWNWGFLNDISTGHRISFADIFAVFLRATYPPKKPVQTQVFCLKRSSLTGIFLRHECTHPSGCKRSLPQKECSETGKLGSKSMNLRLVLLCPWPEFTPSLTDFSVKMPPQNMVKRRLGPKTFLKQTAYAIRKLQKNFNITSLLAKAGNDCMLSSIHNMHVVYGLFVLYLLYTFIYLYISSSNYTHSMYIRVNNE